MASPFAKPKSKTKAPAQSETQASYFKMVHYVYAVDLFRRLFGEANILVLRFERCLGETFCGPVLAAFLGFDAEFVLADPYSDWKNAGAGTANLAKHETTAAHVLKNPNATMGLLGFSPSMVEDILFHEKLLHDLLDWTWEFDAPPAPLAEAASPPEPAPSGDGGLAEENLRLRRENEALRRNASRLATRLASIEALAAATARGGLRLQA